MRNVEGMTKREITMQGRFQRSSLGFPHYLVIRDSYFVINLMFTPRHVKHSRLLLRHARKYLRYKHDKLSGDDREQIVAEMQMLRETLRSRDRGKIHTAAETLDKTLH